MYLSYVNKMLGKYVNDYIKETVQNFTVVIEAILTVDIHMFTAVVELLTNFTEALCLISSPATNFSTPVTFMVFASP